MTDHRPAAVRALRQVAAEISNAEPLTLEQIRVWVQMRLDALAQKLTGVRP